MRMKKTVATLAILLLLSVAAVFLVLGNATLHAQEIVYDGETIRWNSVPFADYYTVSIDGGEPIPCEKTELYYPNGGNFAVTVTVHKSIFSDDAEQRSFRYLQKVEGLQFSDGVLHWDPVSDAQSYTVEINGESVATLEACSYNYDGTQDVVFRVKANSANPVYYSVWSEPYSAHILPMPQNVVYDRETHTVSWDAVPFARAYTVWVDGRYFETSETSYVYHAGTSDFRLQVQAVGAKEEHIFDSLRTQMQTYTYLGTVTDLRIQDGVLHWTGVPSATAYRIRVDGEEVQAQTQTHYDAFEADRAYTVQVLPKSENPYAYSDWQTIAFTVLETPVLEHPTVQGQNVLLSWNPIADAQTYTLRIYRDGALVHTEHLSDCRYTDPFTETGIYTVTVQCDATATKAQSAISEVATVTRLPAVASHTVDELGVVRFAPVVGASSYTVKINNTVVKTNLTETSFALTDGGINTTASQFTVTILPNGTESGNSLLLDATDVYSFLVRKPGKVSGVKVTSTSVSWNRSDGVNGYRVTVIRNNGLPMVQNLGADDLSFPMIFDAPGTYQIKVQAIYYDSQAQCVPSDSAKAKDVVRLAQPDVRLQHDDEALFWDPVEGATGYKVYVDNTLVRTIVANSNPSFDLRSYITANERKIYVYAYSSAVSAATLYLDSAPSETIPFCRLGTPTSVKVDNTNITWTPVAGATRYEIYIKPKNGTTIVKVCKDGTVYNHSYAIGVGEHTVSVCAFSDDLKYLPAATSGTVTVFRLPTPNITTVRGETSLKWNVPAALEIPTGYSWDYISLSCNGQETRLDKTVRSYAPQNLTYGAYGDRSHQYLIQLQFVGSGDATFGKKATISSLVDEYSFVAMKAPTPTVYFSTAGGKVVGASVTGLPSASVRVRFECNGEVKVGTAGSFTQKFTITGQSVQYRAQILGGFFDGDVYYGDSEWSDYGYETLP